MYKKKCLAFVIAGGKGERLYPLTKDRSKPSVPFGGKYRIVDFVLSNLINSGIYSIYVLVQYKSQSLIEHIRTSPRRSGLSRDHFITVVPAQMRTGESSWYKGTADSIFQNINLIIDSKPDLVLVFAADHIYRMDVQQMIDRHLATKADATVATLPIAVNEAHNFGVIKADSKGRITEFIEKPAQPGRLFAKKANILTSMGNYIFNTNILLNALRRDAPKKESAHDFGRNIMPELIKTNKVYSYCFADNKIPGLNNYEEKAYWRDVGNIQSYWMANMSLTGDKPELDLNNKSWPIMTSDIDSPPARITKGNIHDSIIGEGTVINNATVHNSIIGRGVTIEKESHIEDSIIMGYTKIGRNSKIKKAIIDRYNAIEHGTKIGYSLKEDKKNYFVDRESGIVILPRGGRNWL